MYSHIRGGYKAYLFFLLAAQLIGIQSCSSDTVPFFKICKSDEPVVDLSAWSFEQDGPVRLFYNTWELYWNKLYYPDDFAASSGGSVRLAEPVSVKGSQAWNGVLVDGRPLPANGFATYRMIIRLPEEGKNYCFYMTNQDSAYRMWINGKLSAENGIVAVNADDYRPQRLPKCIFHFAESPEIEVVMQIANYSHKWGGLTNNIYFGLPSQILRYINRLYGVSIFICGAILIFAMYHLFLFLNRKQNLSFLFFSLFCFSAAIWYLYSTDYLFFQFFPDFPMNLGIRINFIFLFISSTFFILYINSSFPGNLSRSVIRIIFAAGGFLMLSTMIFPLRILTSIILNIFFVIVILHSLLVFIVLIRAIIKGTEGVWLSAIGFMIFFISVIYDMAAQLKFIVGSPFGPFMPYSLVILILLQSFFMAAQFSGAYKRLDDLSHNLEYRIRLRTKQLITAHKENTEREKLAAVGTLVGGISHELMNPLSGITGPVSILKKEVMQSSAENSGLLLKHIEFIESNAEMISRSVKNLNALIKNRQADKTQIHVMPSAHKAFRANENKEKNIEFVYIAEPDTDDAVSGDESMLFQILNNLVSNSSDAISASGKIIIRFSHSTANSSTRITVEDDGCGMDQSVLQNAFHAFYTTKETSGGTGLGLFLVKKLAGSLGWTVEIDSEPGRGTSVTLIVGKDDPPSG